MNDLAADAALMLEILGRVGQSIEMGNLLDLAEEPEAKFGSTEDAIAAIKSGTASLA
jgi:hypothetical protein